jgi:hypothetical protein
MGLAEFDDVLIGHVGKEVVERLLGATVLVAADNTAETKNEVKMEFVLL